MIAQCRTAVDPRHVSRGVQRYLERNMDNIVIISRQRSDCLSLRSSFTPVNERLIRLLTWNCFFVIAMNVSREEISLWCGDLFILMDVQK